MPELLKKTIEELRKIIHEEYGVILSFGEASEIAYGLVGYFDTLAKISSQNPASCPSSHLSNLGQRRGAHIGGNSDKEWDQ